MDNRELSIMIGQCINLAHNEALDAKLSGAEVDAHVTKRVPQLLRVSIELRKALRGTK